MKIVKRRDTRQNVKNIAIAVGFVTLLIACDVLMSFISMT